jgi:hypothetical protein
VAGLVARRGRQDAPIGRRARFARLPCWPRAPRNRHTVTRPSTSAMPIDGDAVAIGMTNGSDQDLANSTWRRTVDMVLLPCMQRACSRATNHATRTVNIGKRLMCRDNFPGAARQAGLSAPRQPANLDRQERGAQRGTHAMAAGRRVVRTGSVAIYARRLWLASSPGEGGRMRQSGVEHGSLACHAGLALLGTGTPSRDRQRRQCRSTVMLSPSG